MSLTRDQIVHTAMGILREYGLADLSMRRLARDLGVQPGALYWHVKNKQELLTVLAGLILAPINDQPIAGQAVGGQATVDQATVDQAMRGLRELAVGIRTALLSVRDGAEVVALAHALETDTSTPLRGFRILLLGQGWSTLHAEWAAEALVHYVLGSVTDEQTRAGLTSAGLLSAPQNDPSAAFDFGLGLMLDGLAAQVISPAGEGPGAAALH